MKTKLFILFLIFSSYLIFSQTKPVPQIHQHLTGQYLNPKLSIEERVNDLIKRMTLEEKVSQMINNAPAITRLGIPQYNWWNECLHGVARNGLATVFPEPIGLAATWDRSLIHKLADAISDEARAKYYEALKKNQRGIYQGLTFWSPNINIFRDPRWGRGMETYGEDPYLTGQMAIQFIEGLQGNNPKYFKVIATAKHFAVHSGPESLRHSIDLKVSDYDLNETYLPAFKASVEDAKVYSIMCAYNSFRGNACCSNDPLLNNILRNDWGFKGYVVSDCDAIDDIYRNHKQANDAKEASAKALEAGTDINCGKSYKYLIDAVKKGLVSEALIDTSVKRLFTARFKLGMFDPPSLVTYSKINMTVVDSKEHRNLALKSARESIVLLKNEGNLLPLKKNIKKIAFIGPNADDEEVLLGNYNGYPAHVITPLEGIKNKIRKHVKIFYAQGCDIAQNMPTYQVIPSKNLFISANKKEHGLKGEYYNNHLFEGKPKFVRVDSKIDFNWFNGRPRFDFKYDDFSVRWKGYLVPSKSGEYLINGFEFGSYKIYVDDSLKFDSDQKHHSKINSQTLALTAGKAYEIKIEYSENSRFGMMHLQWSVPDDNMEKRALDIVKKSDVAILFMGLSPRLEGEEMNVPVKGFNKGDRLTMNLPATQEDLINKIIGLGKPLVLVLLNGSALSINSEVKNIPAIVESWYGGEASGTAIVDVLFGDYNPGGKLPVTFYKFISELPPFTDYNMKGRTYRYFDGPVIFPFGYGLSYTTFSFANLRLDKNEITQSESAKILVDVKNTGKRSGGEVVQMYVKGNGPENNDAIESLKGFQRIFLMPGQTKTIEFNITPKTLQRYEDGKGFVVNKGEHIIMIGSSSKSSDLKEIKIKVK
jgi:beta-glucosidase